MVEHKATAVLLLIVEATEGHKAAAFAQHEDKAALLLVAKAVVGHKALRVLLIEWG